MVRLDKPMEFDAIDDVPVDLLFLMLVPDQAKGDYLKMLASIARTMRVDGMLAAIRTARSSDEIFIALTTEAAGSLPV